MLGKEPWIFFILGRNKQEDNQKHRFGKENPLCLKNTRDFVNSLKRYRKISFHEEIN